MYMNIEKASITFNMDTREKIINLIKPSDALLYWNLDTVQYATMVSSI